MPAINQIKTLTVTLFFLLELATYAVAIWWGFAAFTPWPLKLLAGLGTPLVLGAVWTRFGAPKSKHLLTGARRSVLVALWFGSGVAGLLALGHPVLAAAFGVLAVVASVGEAAMGLAPGSGPEGNRPPLTPPSPAPRP